MSAPKDLSSKIAKQFTNEMYRKVVPELTDEQCDSLRKNLRNKLEALNTNSPISSQQIKDWMFPLFQDLKEIAESSTIMFVEQPGRDFNGWKVKFVYTPSIGEFVELTKDGQRMCFTRDHLIKNSPFMLYQQFKAGCNV